jgi:hypothetical protein
MRTDARLQSAWNSNVNARILALPLLARRNIQFLQFTGGQSAQFSIRSPEPPPCSALLLTTLRCALPQTDHPLRQPDISARHPRLFPSHPNDVCFEIDAFLFQFFPQRTWIAPAGFLSVCDNNN